MVVFRVHPDAPSRGVGDHTHMSCIRKGRSRPVVDRRWRTAALALSGVAALGASRAWLRDWGATPAEIAGALPGDPMVPEPAEQTTRAVTAEAPREAVWPWLVQMGWGRGGFYSYSAVERALGVATPGATRVEPGLQDLRVGDTVRMTPDPYLIGLAGRGFSVVDVDPPRSLGLLQRRPSGALIGWVFVLRGLPDGRTRVIVRTRRTRPTARTGRLAHWAESTLLGPGEAIMERGMLRGLARRATRG